VLQSENYWQGLFDGKDQEQQWKLQNLEGHVQCWHWTERFILPFWLQN